MSQSALDKARRGSWGYLDLERGRVICFGVSREKVVLVEPDAGFFYPMPGEVRPIPMPDEPTLVSTITGVPASDLDRLRVFCSVPRTMQEVEAEFPTVRAAHLRALGVLKDTGRQGRRIVSEWAGVDLNDLLEYVFGRRDVPTRQNNNPAR
jgi:hypothetical protein